MAILIAARAPKGSGTEGYNVVCSKCKALLRASYNPGTKDYLRGKRADISMCGPCYKAGKGASK